MDNSTDLTAVRVSDDEVDLYSVSEGGWYAIGDDEKAVLGPFEVWANATGQFANGSASWHRQTFPVSREPRFIEA